ncbi:autism susceptibility gene 2 protein isoform X4 [Linepithema humile]|uniref:autism susceptibility gene 2 protein isoform X4 n=1 Tax=Linepithema humile TaxID=83485 RepID=UPI00351EE872
MEIEAKQRSQKNRRRERAQRMLAQRESLATAKQQQQQQQQQQSQQSRQRPPNDEEDSHSGEDEDPAGGGGGGGGGGLGLGLGAKTGHPRDGHSRPPRPPRPPRPRKKSSLVNAIPKEALFEEDIIDGFAILAFRTYEELESAIKLAGKNNVKKLHTLLSIVEEKPKVDTGQNNRHNEHHIKNNFKHNHYTHNSILTPSTLNQGLDAGTSDDSGRASEQLHGPGIPRDCQDADSSRDHLSDASSHCSSGKGYICDSEGEDDKGSDAESILFESSTPPPLARKYELPSSSPHVLPPANGAGGSPPDTGGQISNPATDAPAPIPPPVPASAPVPTAPSPPSPTLPPHISQPPMTSPLAANPRAIAPQQRPASPALPPPSLSQQPHTTIPALHPPNVPLVSSSHTTSPAVASLGVTPAAPSNGAATTSYPPPIPIAAYPQTQPSYPPLYTPYTALNHSPYLPPAVPSPSHSASSRADVRGSRASPCTNISKQTIGNNLASHNNTPLSAATTTCVSTITNTVTTANSIAHRDMVACSLSGRNNNSPRGHSPSRERDSYSSNVSSLSRGSITPVSVPNTSSPANSSLPAYTKPQGWISNTASQLSPATATSVPRPTPPPVPPLGMHTFPPPMFAAPLPPPVSSSSPHTSLPSLPPPTTNPNPFSAESLFQTKGVTHVTGQADLLRRELDSRFLASQDRSVGVGNLGPPAYLRTEMHHHQHQHTHVHQHTTPLLPSAAATTLFPPPIFKDIPKLGGVESPFFRGNLNLSGYSGFNTGLLHPGIGPPSTPFVPPNHLTTFAPKKSGKWNAMHVRIAWEIYNHQQKQQAIDAKAAGNVVNTKTELLRPPGHLYAGGPGGGLGLGAPSMAPPFPTNMPPTHPAPPPPHPVGFLSTPASHLGNRGTGMSPFGRYPSTFGAPNHNFPGLSTFPPREMGGPLGGLGSVHDPWRGLQRATTGFPPTTVSWGLKPEPPAIDRRAELEEREREREREREQRERERERVERERERIRREREREREREEQRERERREREKEEKRKQQEAAERERERRDKERREMERREMERERLLHQNRQHVVVSRDRSPLRNGAAPLDTGEIRVKEEPRSKDDEVVMLPRPPVPAPGATGPAQGPGPNPLPDPRYHHPHPHAYLTRHPHSMQASHSMPRSMLPSLSAHQMQHFPPPSGPTGQPGAPWPGDPFRDYRYDPLQQLRYNPLMAAFRAEEEERAKLYASYPPPPVNALRSKDPSPGPLSNLHMHHRAGPGPGVPARPLENALMHADIHKKEDGPQSR